MKKVSNDKVIKLGESYIKNNSSINKRKWESYRSKLEFVERCVYIEYNEAINSVQSWKFWKNNPTNNLDVTMEEIADVFIFMMDLKEPKSIITTLDNIDEYIKNSPSFYPNPCIDKTINLIVHNIKINIYEEFINSGDLNISYNEFMKDVIQYIYKKLNINILREDHINYETK